MAWPTEDQYYDPTQAVSATGYTLARLLQIMSEEITSREGKVWGIPIHLEQDALAIRIDFKGGNHRNVPTGTHINFPAGAALQLEIVNQGPGDLYYSVNMGPGEATALLEFGAPPKQLPDTRIPKYESINLLAKGGDVDLVINVGV